MKARNYNTVTVSNVETNEPNVSVKKQESNFYTQNGWHGSKYEIGKGAKEVAKELRAYIKADPELNVCKWSIRSTFGMSADSLYISLMGAPFDPFSNEYKEKHEYRYNRGYSEHGTIEDYTTPEAYKLMLKVKAFVMQYIHDDSDGMIDYFDRNIYDHYEIGRYDKPFQIIEKKERSKQNEPSNEPKKVEPAPTTSGLEIVDYSEKAIAVFGETKEIKDQLKEIGGRFNPSLKYNGGKRAGWIFSKKQAGQVHELVAPSKNGLEHRNIGTSNSEKSMCEIVSEDDQNASLIITDYEKYAAFDYLTGAKELDGFKLGEVVFDQIGEIGVILAFGEYGTVRLNSNGVCNVGNLKKCPRAMAEREVILMDVIRPEKVRVKDLTPNVEYMATPSDEKSEVYTREAYGMMVKAYFVDEEKFIPKGEYKETTLDQQKKEADILLKSIDGNWYTIYSNIEIELKNKRIRRYDNGCIAVPESIYNKLKAKYNVMCDF